MSTSRRVRILLVAALTVLSALRAGAAHAGGGPENAVLVVDPASPESLYLANHYAMARGLPASNIVYMPPGAATYAEMAGDQTDAFLAALQGRGIDDHVDYVIVPPGGSFFVPMPDLVNGLGCPAPVRRMSISSAYTLAHVRADTLRGDRTIMETNRFFGTVDTPLSFDARTAYAAGRPSGAADARRYLIGFMLGYTGRNGNTIDEIVSLVDRSVASDGTRPDGTFYFVRTSDIRSTPRHGYYPAIIAALGALGGHGEELFKEGDEEVLVPRGRHDILGVATGHAGPPIATADMTVLPGAFADHITSFAATFDTDGQVKLSRWIARGAVGSMGTVEEPCVFGEGITGKFPHPRLHLWYFQGMSLGESLLRSIQWAPYQGLFYGDPLARPFASIPRVDVPDVPSGPVRGDVSFTPIAHSPLADTGIATVEVFVDGRREVVAAPGDPVSLDTSWMAAGVHDLRVVVRDDSPVATQGRWLGALEVAGDGRRATLDIEGAPHGDLSTVFTATLGAAGGAVGEIRLWQGRRMLAAVGPAGGTIPVAAATLGAGRSALRSEALFADGGRAWSAPIDLAIDFVGSPAAGRAPAPVAGDVTLDVSPGQPVLLDLPGMDAWGAPVTFEAIDQPARAPVTAVAGRLLARPEAAASGVDRFQFRVVSGGVAGEPSTVTLRYCAVPFVVARPTDVNACAGADAEMRVLVDAGARTFQWLRNGLAIPGANRSRLLIRSVGADDLGEYAVQVTSRCGDASRTVTSAPARLGLDTDPIRCRPRIYMPLAARR